ncbi:tol-pal system YbgF family protein [Myxococcota bacterium]
MLSHDTKTSVGIVLVAQGLLCSWPAVTRAQSPEDDAKRLFEAGTVRYNLGQFDQALVEYSNAYELTPLPGFLFNIGQCHRQLGNQGRAIFFFEGYLREAPDGANAIMASKFIKAARAEIDDRTAQHERFMSKVTPCAPRGPSTSAQPFYERWWFWTIVGTATAVIAVSAIGFSTQSCATDCQ